MFRFTYYPLKISWETKNEHFESFHHDGYLSASASISSALDGLVVFYTVKKCSHVIQSNCNRHISVAWQNDVLYNMAKVVKLILLPRSAHSMWSEKEQQKTFLRKLAASLLR